MKSQTGRLDEIRGCLGINQDCRAFDPHLHCAVNAEVGRGRLPGVGVQIARAKEIYVIGGGPAGLEAARVSAERGHRVSLFERDTSLGGAVRIAAASPHRATLIDIVDYLERETRRLKVDVNLGAPISLDDLEEITGHRRPRRPGDRVQGRSAPGGLAVPRRGLRRRGSHQPLPA